MEIVVIVCELVIAVCTLVYLFGLQHSVDSGVDAVSQHSRREMALGFLSLAFTLGVLVVTAIGTDKVTRGVHALVSRVRATSAHSLSVFGPMTRRGECSTSVGIVPVSGDEAVDNQEAVEVA